jgi:Ca2+-binding EF-hand superfamily protein
MTKCDDLSFPPQVFDKEGTGKVPLPEVQNILCSLGEKLEQNEATKLCELLGVVAVSGGDQTLETFSVTLYYRNLG